mmetsp:Transcript_11932/g.33636  ORF Transcript_11932/g.33636 Transcript_11932/m.33636 type:complete len:165 (-) Transcript_11932:83-577(-)
MSSSDDDTPLVLLALASGKVDEKPKGKAKKNEPKAEGAEKKARPKFDRPGQTRPTPPESDPLRRYYTSLYSQQPDSALAQRFCAQHGLMPLEMAEKWAAEHGRGSQLSQRSSQPSQSPAKAPAKKAPAKKAATKKDRTPPKKRGPSRVRNDKIESDESDSEFEP